MAYLIDDEDDPGISKASVALRDVLLRFIGEDPEDMADAFVGILSMFMSEAALAEVATNLQAEVDKAAKSNTGRDYWLAKATQVTDPVLSAGYRRMAFKAAKAVR